MDGARIMQHLQALAEFGKNPQGGVSRLAYTEADRQGREFAMRLMREAQLDVQIDAAGNIVGSRAGSDASLKPLLIGSHIDSVPEGGNYDGDVGSLSAIEVELPRIFGILQHEIDRVGAPRAPGVVQVELFRDSLFTEAITE